METSWGITNMLLVGLAVGNVAWIVAEVIHFALAISYKFSGFRFYKIDRTDNMTTFCKKVLPISSDVIDGEKAHGVVYGRWYIGKISEKHQWHYASGVEYTAWLFTNKRTYDRLVGNEESPGTTNKNPSKKYDNEIHAGGHSDKNTTERPFVYKNLNGDGGLSELEKQQTGSKITIIEDKATFVTPEYATRSFVLYYTPKSNQERCISNIMCSYKSKASKALTCYVHGAPGSGKSVMSMFLAFSLNAKFCKDLRPNAPGNSLGRLYTTSSPTENSPLVLVLEEADRFISDMHDGKLMLTKHDRGLKPGVCDKTSWNGFLDSIDNGWYPHLIFLMLSNSPPSVINTLDSSYIRPGRVHLTFDMEM